MRAARIWLSIVGAGYLVLAALLLVTLFTPVSTGALTRIGQISEHQFQGRDAPPDIPLSLIRQSPIEQADILVVGDSFSNYFAWQTELVAAGYRVSTTHWDWTSPLCKDFAGWLKDQGFKGRLVLLESIEYLVPERLDAMRDCTTSMQARKLKLSPPPTVSPSPPPPVSRINSNARLMTGFNTWQRTRQIERTDGVVEFKAERRGASVFASPLENGCAEFSHRLCEKNLFLSMDRINPELNAADAQFMHQFVQDMRPLQVRWMMIPNKTTVYLDRDRAQAFAQRARELAIGPDLFTVAQEGRRAMRDLYWPNDNHWSMQGQLYFGRHMLDYVRQTIGAPAAPASN